MKKDAILPMRNWNKDLGKDKSKGKEDAILPMRNWNASDIFYMVNEPVKMLFYLWGIETSLSLYSIVYPSNQVL